MNDVHNPLSPRTGRRCGCSALLPLVYGELRKLASQRIVQESPGQTLQATALVHEAYLQPADVKRVSHFDRRGHFFAAAEAMRRILVENARRKKRLKRGDDWQQVELEGLRLWRRRFAKI